MSRPSVQLRAADSRCTLARPPARSQLLNLKLAGWPAGWRGRKLFVCSFAFHIPPRPSANWRAAGPPASDVIVVRKFSDSPRVAALGGRLPLVHRTINKCARRASRPPPPIRRRWWPVRIGRKTSRPLGQRTASIGRRVISALSPLRTRTALVSQAHWPSAWVVSLESRLDCCLTRTVSTPRDLCPPNFH